MVNIHPFVSLPCTLEYEFEEKVEILIDLSFLHGFYSSFTLCSLQRSFKLKKTTTTKGLKGKVTVVFIYNMVLLL